MHKKQAVTYRQYSRPRFIRYRQQYPHMRESQIATNIIYDWDSFNASKDREVQVQRVSKPPKKENEIISTAHKTDQKLAAFATPIQSKRAHVYPPLFPADRVDELKHEAHLKPEMPIIDDQKLIIIYSDPHEARQQIQLSKKHSDNKNSHYIQFYRCQSAKLNEQHPNWSAFQIQKIISLQWKQMRKHLKKRPEKKSKIIQKRRLKLISGIKAFRKMNSFKFISLQDCKKAWGRLPSQSKKQYGRKGKGIEQSKLADKTFSMSLSSKKNTEEKKPNNKKLLQTIIMLFMLLRLYLISDNIIIELNLWLMV